METTKIRKQGNSLVLTISKNLGYELGTEFFISKETDGSLILIPKVPDIYANASENEYKDMDTDNLATGFVPGGAEGE